MFIIDVFPLTKIPRTSPQILSYFHNAPLEPGSLVLIPLGRRQEQAIVLDSHNVLAQKLEIKQADFEMKKIAKVENAAPALTPQQIELALFLGQYYFCSPGLFAKMMLPGKVTSYKLQVTKKNLKLKTHKLILVPTISQAHSSYQSYLSNRCNIFLWHSELTKKQKTETWQAIKTGEAKVIIGARSAVFLPFANLNEIIIEDATNSNHRSWDTFPHFSTITAAPKLSKIFNAKLTLKSNQSSVSLAPFPISPISPIPSQLIDLRAELKDGNFSIFSRALQDATGAALARKKQIILFINRRGASNFILCRDCGFVIKCENCAAPMAYHLINGRPRLLCHRCGLQEALPSFCPRCRRRRLKPVGVGSQKVELEAKKMFPEARVSRLDSDTAATLKDQQKIIDCFIKKETDILVATQMLFSWSEQLRQSPPSVIGLISADTLLHLPDFQAGERTFQTIFALKNLFSPSNPPNFPNFPDSSPPFEGGSGRMFIQTHNPQNPVLQYAANDDWESFYDEEIAARQALNYPPFSQIAKLTFRHKDPKKAGLEAKILAAKLQRSATDVAPTFGKPVPADVASMSRGDKHSTSAGTTTQNRTMSVAVSAALPAFIPKARGKYIWNIIIKFPPLNDVVATPQLRGEQGGVAIPREYAYTNPAFLQTRNFLLQYIPPHWEIDIDPVDLL